MIYEHIPLVYQYRDNDNDHIDHTSLYLRY